MQVSWFTSLFQLFYLSIYAGLRFLCSEIRVASLCGFFSKPLKLEIPLHPRGLINIHLNCLLVSLWLNSFMFYSLVHLVLILLCGVIYGYKLFLHPNCKPILLIESLFFLMCDALYFILSFFFYLHILGIFHKKIQNPWISHFTYVFSFALWQVIWMRQLYDLLQSQKKWGSCAQ